MRHLDEAQPAVLVEGDVAAGEFHLERHGVVLGAEEHGLLLELRTLLAVREDALAEPLRLLVLVAAGGEDRAPAVGPVGPELFVAALGGLGDERVGGGQDGRRGAVVPRERRDVGAGEALLEVEDVAHRGGAEAVDGLRVVPDAGDAGAVGPQQADDVGLQRVGVLVLVDEDVVEALAHAGAARRVGEQAAPEEQQVVVVQHLLLLLGVGVRGEELRQPFFGRQAPRERRVQHLVQRQLRVDAARVDVEAGGLLREPRAAAAEAEAGAGDVHEVFGVAAVHDREVRRHADVACVDAEQAGGGGVERPAPDALRGAAGAVAARREDRLDPAQHLGGGAAREREQQDAPRVGAALDELGDAVHERSRLAGACAGDDEQRSVVVLGGCELVGVELDEHGESSSMGCCAG